jgi:hypothetical protein
VKPARPDLYQVFVSHATPDKWVATMICEKIDAIAAARTFRDDRDIQGGDDIPEVLRQQIQESAELLVLMTPVSIARPWVLLEVGAAWQAQKRIVAICYHVNAEQIPAMLRAAKAYTLNDFDRYLEEVRGRVERRSS